MTRDVITVVMKKKDAWFIAAAIKYYQEFRGINQYEIKWGVNGLRMLFEEIDKKKE